MPQYRAVIKRYSRNDKGDLVDEGAVTEIFEATPADARHVLLERLRKYRSINGYRANVCIKATTYLDGKVVFNFDDCTTVRPIPARTPAPVQESFLMKAKRTLRKIGRSIGKALREVQEQRRARKEQRRNKKTPPR